MSLSTLCIRRPVMTTILMVASLIFGAVAYVSLPVSELPNVDFPTIQVTANLPGGSPETMAASVATPLEGQFSTIAGISSMTSVSAFGLTQITIQFDLKRDIDAAAQDVQSAIAAAARRLPPDLPTPPTLRKVNPADFPVFYIALSSSTLPTYQVAEYAETRLAQQLSTVSGVAQVLVYGSQKYAVRIRVDPERLAQMGIGLDEVQAALSQGNVNKPTGSMDGPVQNLAVRTDGQLRSAAQFGPLTVVYRNGAPVRLSEIGVIEDSVENARVGGWYNGERAIVLAIQRQPGTNAIETVQAIKRLLPAFREKLPESVKISTLYDRSESIEEGIEEVKFTLGLAGVLVVLVIFLFLRNLSATVIPSIALPMSVGITFGVMYFFGFSIDNLSLLALTLSVGFVVDDAIVVLENIVRHMEMGEKPFEAALKGANEIGFTVISMTLALVAVFIPVLFMGGIVGRLLHQFAIVISVAILASAFVSLTVTPMLASRFLKPSHEQQHGALYNLLERGFDAWRNGYDWTLRWTLRNQWFVFLTFIATVLGTIWLFGQVPKGFLPSGDSGRLIAFTEGAQDMSFQAMVERQRQVVEVIRADPNVEAVNSSVGAGGPRPTVASGTIFIKLKSSRERSMKPDAVVQQLRRKASSVPGIRVFIQNPPPINVGGQLTQAQYQYTLQGLELAEVAEWADRLYRKFRSVPEIQDVASNLNNRSLQVSINIDREKLAPLGLTMGQVQDALNNAFGSRQVSTIYGSASQHQVILELESRFLQDPSSLSRLYVRASTGKLIPLDAVASFERKPQLLTIGHLGQLPAVTISFNLAPGIALGTAVDRIKVVEREMGLPVTVTGSLQGTAQAFQASLKGMGWLLVLAVLVIYMVLGILYENFIHPLTILSGLPSAGVGALATLAAFDMQLNLFAFVGVIMLIGIVKKNAIIMIDFAIERRRQGDVSARDAIYEACLVRFRPIMMTTMAALAGTLPIAIGYGAGGDTRMPLGLSVVGGLMVSQVLTLYLTPVLYIWLDKLSTRLSFREVSVSTGVADDRPPVHEPKTVSPVTAGSGSASQ
jgi:HAE1 family hydrophobic/amphiphilic exporter-1